MDCSGLSSRLSMRRKKTIIDKDAARFPKIQECKHFYYERMNLGPVQFTLMNDETNVSDQFIIHVMSGDEVCSSVFSIDNYCVFPIYHFTCTR